MIVTVHQLLEAAAAVAGEPIDSVVELSTNGKFLVGRVDPAPRVYEPGDLPAEVSYTSFSLPPAPGPAED